MPIFPLALIGEILIFLSCVTVNRGYGDLTALAKIYQGLAKLLSSENFRLYGTYYSSFCLGEAGFTAAT